MSLLKQHIEALIFCSEQSISLAEIQASLQISMGWEVQEEEVIQALTEIKEKYLSEDFAFELLEISEGYQFLTKKEFHSPVSALIQHKAKKKLSVAQMETLSIIAYKQPISKTEIEHIRGVNCDYAVQKLLEKDLIEIEGKGEGPGRPIIYATSQSFMDYFGIKSVKDLPQLKDLHQEQNEIGVPNDLVETLAQPEPIVSEDEQITETVISETEETIILDKTPPLSDLPDRKAIFLEHQSSQQEENIEDSETSSPDEDLSA